MTDNTDEYNALMNATNLARVWNTPIQDDDESDQDFKNRVIESQHERESQMINGPDCILKRLKYFLGPDASMLIPREGKSIDLFFETILCAIGAIEYYERIQAKLLLEFQKEQRFLQRIDNALRSFGTQYEKKLSTDQKAYLTSVRMSLRGRLVDVDRENNGEDGEL